MALQSRHSKKKLTHKTKARGRIFIEWFGRGCLLNSLTKSDFIKVINALYDYVYAAVDIIVFFFAVIMLTLTYQL